MCCSVHIYFFFAGGAPHNDMFTERVISISNKPKKQGYCMHDYVYGWMNEYMDACMHVCNVTI